MCTVTFIPSNGKIFLTSNRDEQKKRLPAIPPRIYTSSSGNICYPKDSAAGGTWFAFHDNGNAIVLLNGGFVKHTPLPAYRRSRGLVVLDLIQQEWPLTAFRRIALQEIEPFTLVIWQEEQLYECRWDGNRKYCRTLNNQIAHIWSSVTLYEEQVIAQKEKCFREWIQQNPGCAVKDILHFHRFSGTGDRHNDLVMNRGAILTVSITALEISSSYATIHYRDICHNNSSRVNSRLQKNKQLV